MLWKEAYSKKGTRQAQVNAVLMARNAAADTVLREINRGDDQPRSSDRAIGAGASSWTALRENAKW